MNKEPCTTVVKKRGRKSKKELEEIALQKASVLSTENINVLIEELNTEFESTVNTISDLVNSDDENEIMSFLEDEENQIDSYKLIDFMDIEFSKIGFSFLNSY